MRDKSCLKAALAAYSLIIFVRYIQILGKNKFNASYRYVAIGVTGMGGDGHYFHSTLVFRVVTAHLGDDSRQCDALVRADIF